MSEQNDEPEMLEEATELAKANNELDEAFKCINNQLKKSTARKDENKDEKIKFQKIFAELKALEVRALADAKAELIVQLNAILKKPTDEKEEKRLEKQFGEGILEVIGRLTVHTEGGKGHHLDLGPYKWIVVTYEDKDKGHKEEYCLALSQQLLDTESGNPHTAFGKIQFWHNLQGTAEAGGDPNGAPVSSVIEDSTSSNQGQNYYFLKYFAEKAYPVALTRTRRGEARIPWNKENCLPWGLVNLDKPEIWQLQLDMADPLYDPKKVAETFIDFVMEDLKKKKEDLKKKKEDLKKKIESPE